MSRRCGLASTATDHPFTEMTALELARNYFLGGDPENISLGLAAVNSLSDVEPDKYIDVDGLQLVKEVGKGKNISVIGHFPFLDDLAKEAGNLWIIDNQPRPGDLTEEEGKDFLPRSDMVAISSTTLINQTLSGILDLCREGSVIMLPGPTTPLTEVLFGHGFDILAGSVVTDKDRVLQSVSEGASFMQIKKGEVLGL